MKAVTYECVVSRRTEKLLCQFHRNDLVLLDIALHYFISRIN